MTETDIEGALAELDRLLNDPEVRMDPDRVWTILAEVSPLVAGNPPAPAAIVRTGGSPRPETPGFLPGP